MARPSEEISRYRASSNGKTDANLANDANHLGGVPAEEYATKKYVQDYHDKKERALKEYIDEQDEKGLERAKAFVETEILGQDFSDFLKTADRLALESKIKECGTSCETKLNGLKSALESKDADLEKQVNDLYQGMNGHSNELTQLQGDMNELFQSVSNGKKKVAAAITDKGVLTAGDASYDTMASHIRQIDTSGGMDLSEATAMSSDIRKGKLAYTMFGLTEGSLEITDDWNVVLGTDTSNATAVASDIAYGKTAYARGQLIVGTARTTSQGEGGTSSINTAVTEHYGISEGDFAMKRGNSNPLLLNSNLDIAEKTIARSILTFSQDCRFVVSKVTTKDDTDQYDYAIETHAVDIETGGLVYTKSASAYGDTITRKYRYTKEELGLDSREVIDGITLGAPGLFGYDDKCIMVLMVTKYAENGISTEYQTAYIYSYTMSNGGIIGKVNDFDKDYYFKLKCDALYSSDYGLSSNDYTTNKMVFGMKGNPNAFGVGYGADIHLNYYGTRYHSVVIYRAEEEGKEAENKIRIERGSTYTVTSGINNERAMYTLTNPYIQDNDRIVSFSSCVAELNENYEISRLITQNGAALEGRTFYIPTKDVLLNIRTIEGGCSISVYQNNTSVTALGSINILSDEEVNDTQYQGEKYYWQVAPGGCFVTPDYKKLILVYGHVRAYNGTQTYTKWYVSILDLEDLLRMDSEEMLTPIVTELQRSSMLSGTTYRGVYSVAGDTYIGMSGTSWLIISTGMDNQNMIGVTYKGMFFSRIQYGNLTAGQLDVKKGKTFIGWQGYPETGTREDIENLEVEGEEV